MIYHYRKFSTLINKSENSKQLFGYALKDKFLEICRADLIGKVLNKTVKDEMLLRSDVINIKNIGKYYSVYNGQYKQVLYIRPNMVGFKVAEFIFSRKIRLLKSEDTLQNRKKFFKLYKKVKKKRLTLSEIKRNFLNKNVFFLKRFNQKF